VGWRAVLVLPEVVAAAAVGRQVLRAPPGLAVLEALVLSGKIFTAAVLEAVAAAELDPVLVLPERAAMEALTAVVAAAEVAVLQEPVALAELAARGLS
jgi:hypothetical protein